MSVENNRYTNTEVARCDPLGKFRKYLWLSSVDEKFYILYTKKTDSVQVVSHGGCKAPFEVHTACVKIMIICTVLLNWRLNGLLLLSRILRFVSIRGD